MDAHLLFRAHAGKRLHLGVCGSIAAYKSLDLLRAWQDVGLGVSVTLSAAARQFVTPLSFEALGASPVYGDMFGSQTPFEHLEPGQVAHALAVVPASADFLARAAHGRADDMLAAQMLAFDGPVLLAPAMNPRMWSNEATQDNVSLLRERGVAFVGPEKGRVACQDSGEGRMADVRAIFLSVLKALTPQDMEGESVLVTLGPTRETWDDVRYWTNGSTGVMGTCLAIGAWLRGAEVHAVSGPVNLWMPENAGDNLFHRHDVQNAAEMLEAAQDLWPLCQAGIFTAAVSDFRPEPHGPGKFKKHLSGEDGLTLRFLPNQDILRHLAAERQEGQTIVGFAAESSPNAEALAHAVRRKLVSKGADMVVGNKISDGFSRPGNKVFVADIRGREEHWPEMPKPEVAWKILSWMQAFRKRALPDAGRD